VGTVPVDTPETLTIEALVVSPNPVTNTATISHSDQFDPNPSDNQASATVTPPVTVFPFDILRAFPQPAMATGAETPLLLAPLPLTSVQLLTPGIRQTGVPLDSGSEGSVLMAEIVGTVFQDVNADGERQLNEPGWPHRKVVLEGAGQGSMQTTITDEDGLYFFPGLYPARYTVRVILNENEKETTPSDWSIPLGPGERAVAPDIGITERVGRNGPGKAPPGKAPPGRAAPDKGAPKKAAPKKVVPNMAAPEGGLDEFWRLFGLLGQGIVLLGNERESLPQLASRRQARPRRL
jgi:hypothetical protein